MENFIFYLVIAVVGFISWVWRNAQEAAAERQRRRMIEEARRRGETIEEEAQEAFPEAMSPEETVKKLYEALGGAPMPEAPKPQPSLTPPPIPTAKKPTPPKVVAEPEPEPIKLPTVQKPHLTAEELAALARVEDGGLLAKRSRRRAVGADGQPISALALIRKSGGLREAIVLKEILDKPVSMRS